jgi:hypothetical protein
MFHARSAARIVGVAAAIAAAASRGSAQTPAQRLEHPSAVSCTFSTLATGSWVSGQPKVDIKPARLSVAFTAVNVDDGSAEVVNGTGTEDIVVRLAEGNLHFVQSFRQGPIYVTSIWPKETRDGRLQAVHTRHEYTAVSVPGFTSQPEQYYGDCEIK